jgi:3(or 17)beta-hydroxysteroid dehydrogenase
MRLAGKVAIISGAASGMGAATARMFAREGAKVVTADVLEDEGRQVADTIGVSARFEPLDVTKEEDWAAVVSATTRHFGKLDVLVNNAGISGSAEQDFYSTEAWHRIMAVNATGVFLGIKYAIPAMVANGGGSIVNLSSIAGIIGSEHVHMAYNASKAAVRLMTKSVAVQHAKDKIRANSVHPGIMPPMRTSGRTADPAVRAERMRVIPMRRPGEVDEVAYAILFLPSQRHWWCPTSHRWYPDVFACAVPSLPSAGGDRRRFSNNRCSALRIATVLNKAASRRPPRLWQPRPAVGGCAHRATAAARVWNRARSTLSA